INTCGFIESAKEESIDTIIENVKKKSNGRLKKVYAMGCLSERYRVDLEKEIPEVDRFFGSHHMQEVLKELGADYKYELLGERMLSTPNHYAYLKISEGCDNPCSFCAIPLMRGKHVSRSMEEIKAEAELLAEKGVREIVVIGQDTTYYGLDRYGRRRLSELLETIADVQGIEWVRLMYTYPAKFPPDVLDVIANHPHVCKYIDIPLQHVSDEVLKSMRRGTSHRALKDLIARIREKVPGIAMRTTLIVGYPNETTSAFDEVLGFVEETRFDRLGVFTYSLEDGTTAYPLGDPIPRNEKERRRALVMELQKAVSETNNELLIGTRQKVLIDRVEGEYFIGRTERDAPEIDNEVFVETKRQLRPGSFCEVEIVDASEYDLYGCTTRVFTDLNMPQ
ncbi:MAG: 30S ribosomal protein S12 methylthiotransferase RimO, partial [Ignavibacteriae bacterium]|nr:30S ribosomal protein S12 methylthiotransferase RimO [Ignavibacteriota bacterium]